MTVSDAAAEHNIEKVRLGGRRDIENEGMSFRGSKARPMQVYSTPPTTWSRCTGVESAHIETL